MGQSQTRTTLKTAPRISTIRSNTQPSGEVQRQPVTFNREEYKRNRKVKKQQEQSKKNTVATKQIQNTATPIDAYFKSQYEVNSENQQKNQHYLSQKEKILQEKIKIMSLGSASRHEHSSAFLRASADTFHSKFHNIAPETAPTYSATKQDNSYYHSQGSVSNFQDNSGNANAYAPVVNSQKTEHYGNQFDQGNFNKIPHQTYGNLLTTPQNHRNYPITLDSNIDLNKRIEIISNSMRSKNWADVIDAQIPGKQDMKARTAGREYEYKKKDSYSTADPESDRVATANNMYGAYSNREYYAPQLTNNLK